MHTGLAGICLVALALASGCKTDPDPDGSGGAGGTGGGSGGSGGSTGGTGGGPGGTGGASGGVGGLGGLGGLGGEVGAGGSGGAPSLAWTKVELEGAVCADGSQYKFFVRSPQNSIGLAVTMEPGGACWDYDTCGGDGTSRAANLDGIGDDHMTALPPPVGVDPDAVPWGLMFPHMGVSQADVPTANYDQVYLPYCTGDAFMSDFEATYPSEDEEDEIVIEHRGAANMALVLDWLADTYESPEHLLVVGSSAGGLGASFHYAYIRDAVTPERASFINDSSPVFPPGGPQTPARQVFTQRWQTQDFLADLDERLEAPEEQSLVTDSGYITALLSAAFPDDRFLVTYFLSDLNNSLFAYGEAFEDPTVEDLQELWLADTALLVATIDATDNWGYYLPGFRADNCSHCVTLLPVDELSQLPFILAASTGTADGYLRTDLGDLDFGDALDSVIAEEGDLIREQAEDPMTDFSEEEAASCLMPE